MAKKYRCIACGHEPLTRNEVGLNRKLRGRNVREFYCLQCLAEELGATPEDLLEQIEFFKEEGCTLFG